MVFEQHVVDVPASNDVKRYKSYLTRLSKWAAYEQKSKRPPIGVIGVSALRAYLVSVGELSAVLDDDWCKRVFSDKDLFEAAGEGFWKVLGDESPSKPTEWVGVRPDEDVIGDALRMGFRDVVDTGLASVVDVRSQFLLGEDWQKMHPIMLRAMQYAQRRGVAKPLIGMQDRSYAQALVIDDWAVQVIALWFTNTRMLLEALARFRDTVAGRSNSVTRSDLVFYAPQAVQVEQGVLQPVADVTREACLENIRGILTDRGILNDRK